MLKLSILLTAFALWCSVVPNVNAGSLRMTPPPSTRQPADLVCPNAGDFNCGAGECISQSKKCDNKRDCYNGRDEENCPIVSGTIHTTSRQTVIISGIQGRVTTSRPTVYVPESQRPSTYIPDLVCDHPGDFNCGAGQCVAPGLRCDNRVDCWNGWDEKDCAIASGTIHTTSPPTVIHDLVCDHPGDFNCGAGQCVAPGLRCDNKVDCWNGWDEKDCAIASGTIHTTSPPTVVHDLVCPNVSDFNCGSGACVSMSRKCDGMIDCWNGRDELDCPSGTPKISTFTTRTTTPAHPELPCLNPEDFNCGRRQCVPQSAVCDNKRDCDTGLDEENCSSPMAVVTTFTTKYTGFSEQECANPADFNCGRSQCVPRTAVCDKISDCWNGLDEIGCGTVETTPRRFGCSRPGDYDCGAGECIEMERVCDSVRDCSSGIDEQNCGGSTRKPYGSGSSTVSKSFENQGESTTSRSRFGTDNDVQISTDRSAPFVSGSTSKSRFGTDNDVQISTDRSSLSSFWYRSGTTPKGGFGTDNDIRISTDRSSFAPHQGTNNDVQISTDHSSFAPHQGTNNDVVSVDRSTLFGITGSTNRVGSSVVSGKSGTPGRMTTTPIWDHDCPSVDEFPCGSGQCIPRRFLCDGHVDCYRDGRDEQNCNCDPLTTFKCDHDWRCVLNTSVCDYIRDCTDGSDEANCTYRECNSTEFRCQNEQCVSADKKCDHYYDCYDGTDEWKLSL